MRGVLWNTAVGLAIVALWASDASAHSLDFGVLRVTETPDGAALVLRAAGHEGTPPDLDLHLDGACVLEAPPSRMTRGDRIEVRAACRGALEGTRVTVDGISEELTVAVIVERSDGSERGLSLDLGAPSFSVGAAPDTSATFARYLRLGLEHLALGWDHLLFLIALVLVVRRARPDAPLKTLAWTVSGFTLGHSLTLSLQVLGGLSLPSGPVEACIALSIVMLAAELARPPRETWTFRHPATVATTFGLLHGLGFAGALSELGWPEGDAPIAILAFNLGIEIAQIGVVAVAYPIAAWVSRRRLERAPAYAIGAVAAFWTLSRLGDLII